MTLIELYDKARIENIAGALLARADKLVLVGNQKNEMERSRSLYEEMLMDRGRKTEVCCISVNRNNLQNIIEKLSEVVEANNDCIFDLTGGDDLFLVAAGVLIERYKDKVKCHRFNLKNSTVTDCDADGNTVSVESFDVSIEENIRLYGGRILDHGYKFTFNEEFNRDAKAIWDIAKEDLRYWNFCSLTLKDIIEYCKSENSLGVSYSIAEITDMLRRRNASYGLSKAFLQKLEARGLINSLRYDDDVFFVFKNEAVMEVLSVPGKMLEVAVASKLSEIKDKDGNKLYNDIRVGVMIDWSSTDSDSPTLNEIDVLAMKDAIPIFISCKSGIFDADELYKLQAVSMRFGQKYAKSVIVYTSPEALRGNLEYIRGRADDMGIRRIEDPDGISDAELGRVLRSLYLN
ncbi:MAG: DUF1887 family protein [Campylobacter sp.]|nr:DUF1887 family protein [Campylobacter sp.]